MTASDIRRMTLFLGMLLLLVAGIYFSVRGVLADLQENAVISALDSWEENGSVPSLNAWRGIYGRISELTYGQDLAGQIDSADFHSSLLDREYKTRVGNYSRLLALVYEWRLFVDEAPVNIIDELMFRDLAIQAWAVSVKMRPAWPEGWSQLARHKAFVGEIDDEFYRSLVLATRLGRTEQAAQLHIIQTASMSWPYLNKSYDGVNVKAEVLATIESALSSSHNLSRHLALLSAPGLLEEICAQLDQNRLVTRARQACSN